MSKLREFFKQISYILYPKRCFFCGEIINAENELCPECLNTPEKEYKISEPHCKSCGCASKDCSCRGRAMFYSDMIVPYYYTGPAYKAVRLYKFNDKREKALEFAGCMLERIEELYPDRPFDRICYVPQTKNEMRDRGYNQAEYLARKLSGAAGIETLDALVKLYDTKRQHDLPSDDRSGNVMGVFDVICDVEGLNILLADDVKTTGATLNECAKMLMISGANTVTAAVYAVTKKELRG